jgi:hypothetical protein
MNRQSLAAVIAFVALLAAGEAVFGQAKPAPKKGTYARDEQMLSWNQSWKKDFPNLKEFEVLAPSTGKAGNRGAYNCIAHTLRIYNRWVWEGNKLSDFDKLYGDAGYRRIRTLDYRFNPRYEKVVLYAKTLPNGVLDCTHGSRQLADGTWTSKLGAGPLIRHRAPNSVNGPSYGQPVYVYVRPRKQPILAPKPSAKRPATTLVSR